MVTLIAVIAVIGVRAAVAGWPEASCSVSSSWKLIKQFDAKCDRDKG